MAQLNWTDSSINGYSILSGYVDHGPATRVAANDKTFVADPMSSTSELLGASGRHILGVGLIESTSTMYGSFINAFSKVGLLESTSTIEATFYRIDSGVARVAWSKIGDTRIVMDLTNDAGWMPMHWKGIVLNTVQFGSSCIVLGTNGVSQLLPVSSPAASFGLQELSNIGLLNKLAVTTEFGLDDIFYLNKKKELCVITRKSVNSGDLHGRSKVQVLGFDHQLSVLSSDAVVSYDVVTRRVYIRDATHGFIFSNTDQLGGGPSNISAIVRDSATVSFYSPVTKNVLENVDFTTGSFDMHSSAKKTTDEIAVITDHPGPIYVSVGVRDTKTQNFVFMPPTLCNSEYVATQIATGVEFRVRVFTSLSKPIPATFEAVIVQYSANDKRFKFFVTPEKG